MSKLFLLVVLALVECARSDALSATSDGQLTKLATPNEDLATQSEQDGKRILRATGARTPSGGWDGLLPYANSKIKANYGAVSKMSKKSGHKKKPAKGLFRKKKKTIRHSGHGQDHFCAKVGRQTSRGVLEDHFRIKVEVEVAAVKRKR